MAAITNEKAWKQAALIRLEKITDIWDIVKAACGRSAEVVLSFCMFAQLIGVLPGVHYWPWADNFILAVQVIMLDMGAFALHTLADQARENGQDDAAEKADKLGTFLIRLMITTIALIIIGQVSPVFGDYGSLIKTIVGYIELALILVRVVSTVRFIHVIHSLRGSTLSVQSVAPPDYTELAAQLLPLLRNDLQALIPAQQPIDYQVVAQQIETRITTVVEERLTNLLPAPRNRNAPQHATVDATPVRRITQQLNEMDAPTTRQNSARVARLGAPKKATTSAPTARQKALKLLARNPNIEPVELARKAEITASYARKIISEQQKGN